jgi:hypothetical protein
MREFPGGEAHLAVILGSEARLANKPKVNVIYSSGKSAASKVGPIEAVINKPCGLGNPRYGRLEVCATRLVPGFSA